MMKNIQTTALVLKTCNMNDNDKLVTFFSPAYGRLTAIGKGVRSHKHKDFAALQPFCFTGVTLNCKDSGLYTVAATDVASNFYDLRTDVLKVAFATYYMDVVADIAQEIVGDEDFFSFILNTLYLTEKAEKYADEGDILPHLKKLKTIFEIKTACVIGVMPEISRCVCCGKEKELNHFSYADGGVVCDNCIGRYDGKEHPPVCVDELDLKIMEFVIKSDRRSVFNFKMNEEYLDRVCAISERFLCVQNDTFYKSLSYLHGIIRGEFDNNSEK